MVSEENENGDLRYFAYDANNQLVEKTDRNERVTEYDYDNLGRMVEETWLDGATVIRTFEYTYDAADKLTSAADDDSAYAYGYDDYDRLETIDNAGTAGVPQVLLQRYYDELYRLAKVQAAIDSVADFENKYTFDNLSRVTKITQTGQSGGNTVAEKRVDLAYNAGDALTSVARYKDTDGGSGNLVIDTTYGYDGIGRLTSMDHKDSSNVVIAGYDWAYDAHSRVTQFVSSVDGSSDYGYDNTDQLTTADHNYQTDESYSYDENGNRTMSGYTTDANNRMSSDGTFNYIYDDEGNRLSRTRISNDSADDKTTEYTWDYRNRLTKYVEKNNGGDITKQIEFTYDVFNRRIAKSADMDGEDEATITRFVYDGWNIVLRFDGSGALLNRYVHGIGEDQILVSENAENELVWALTDNQGTVRDLVDNDGDVLNHITYSSYGQILTQTNSSVVFIGAFQGAELDTETGLQLHDRRYYEPSTGKWIKEDAKGFAAGDTNLARMEGNGPTNATDPSGLEPFTVPFWPPKDGAVGQEKVPKPGSYDDVEAARTRGWNERSHDPNPGEPYGPTKWSQPPIGFDDTSDDDSRVDNTRRSGDDGRRPADGAGEGGYVLRVEHGPGTPTSENGWTGLWGQPSDMVNGSAKRRRNGMAVSMERRFQISNAIEAC